MDVGGQEVQLHGRLHFFSMYFNSYHVFRCSIDLTISFVTLPNLV